MKIERIGDAKDLMKKGFLGLVREATGKPNEMKFVALPMFTTGNVPLLGVPADRKRYEKFLGVDRCFELSDCENGCADGQENNCPIIEGYGCPKVTSIDAATEICFVDPDTGIFANRASTRNTNCHYITPRAISKIHKRIGMDSIAIIYDESLDRGSSGVRKPEKDDGETEKEWRARVAKARGVKQIERKLEALKNAYKEDKHTPFRAFTYWSNFSGPSFVVIAASKSGYKMIKRLKEFLVELELNDNIVPYPGNRWE